MALTIKNIYKVALQPSEFLVIVKVTGDSAYPGAANAHGYPVTPATFSLNAFANTSDFGDIGGNSAVPIPTAYYVGADIVPNASAGGTYSAIDDTTGNLRMYAAAGTELASAASATAVSATLIALGH